MNTLYYHYGIRYIGIFLQIRHLVANLFLIFLYLRGDVQKNGSYWCGGSYNGVGAPPSLRQLWYNFLLRDFFFL